MDDGIQVCVIVVMNMGRYSIQQRGVRGVGFQALWVSDDSYGWSTEEGVEGLVLWV